MSLKVDGVEVGTTPMLIPAVSSKLNVKIAYLLETVEEVVNGPFLLSSYDYYYSGKPRVSFPDLIFLDSGGYECNRDRDITDIGMYNPSPKKWKERNHKAVIDDWDFTIPTSIISFDHPSIRENLDRQIARAKKLYPEGRNFLKELLIKPETTGSSKVNIDSIAGRVNSLSHFNIIGFTEKELGSSILDRMISIATVRKILDRANLSVPIHIFGSLDAVTTPLYFMSGADIFDGLSWLRFLFHGGNAHYIDSIGPMIFGISENVKKTWIRSVYQNYSYMQKLRLDMEKFCDTQDFAIFRDNGEFFRESLSYLDTRMGVE